MEGIAPQARMLGVRILFPLQLAKTPRAPNLSKICPGACFGGFQSGELKLSCTRLRVPPVALHLSRYTCRS